MPRFYLDVLDGDQVIQDLEGIDFDDHQTATMKVLVLRRGPGAPGVHRRDRGQHQDDAAAWAQPSRTALARLGAVRPLGHQTFIAALRCDGLTAPWVVDGAMNRAAFNAYVETQLAPTLRPGDVVIADNLSVHKSARAATALKARGAWFLFLPQYSPELNPIENVYRGNL